MTALLAGCSTPIPQALAPQMQPKSFATRAPDQAKIWPEPSWWQGFGDPQLTSLVGEAQTGARVRINTPQGRYGIAQSPDPRFTSDEDNPTIRAATRLRSASMSTASDSITATEPPGQEKLL